MARTPRIALILSATDVYSHRISAGIGEYADAHSPWDFSLQIGKPARLEAIPGWPASGVITNLVSGGFDKMLHRSGTVAVAITNRRPEGPLRRVIIDDEAVGRLAAEHLLDRGLRHFLYVGHTDPRHGGSMTRGRAFAAAVVAAGGDCRQRRATLRHRRQNWDAAQHELACWVEGLDHPLGVFAYTDHEAWPIVQACRRAELTVPEDVAVLGVTDDPLVTRLANPPLSSISLPLEKLGYEAARMLNVLLRGEQPSGPVHIQPEGVIERRSTQVLAVDDEDVVAALRYIRAHAHRAPSVEDICEAVAVSRRSLQRKMRDVLGRTLSEEVRRVRMERAKRLLREAHLPVAEVARRCGFAYLHHFCRVFRATSGCTPSEYRARYIPGP